MEIACAQLHIGCMTAYHGVVSCKTHYPAQCEKLAVMASLHQGEVTAGHQCREAKEGDGVERNSALQNLKSAKP